jgi:hypothetical protein
MHHLAMDRSRTVYPLVFAALHVQIALLAAPDLLLGRAVDAPMELGDVRLYYRYATAVVEGKVPYRDFDIEYPILAVPCFLLPRLFAADFDRYKLLFAAQMLAVNALTVWLVAREVGRGGDATRVVGSLTWYTFFFFPMARFIITRFDPLVMLLCFGSASWWFSRPSRGVLGGTAAGLGALVKIVPALIALPAMLKEHSGVGGRRARGTLAFLSVLALGAAAWLAVGGRRIAYVIRYHIERGVEIGSVYSGLARLVGPLVGTPTPVEWGHGSFNLGGPWAPALSAVATPVQAAALGVILWRFRRSGMGDGLGCAAALLFAFVGLGKVLSPQFLIWLIPFAAARGETAARSIRPVFLACCALTAAVYLFNFGRYLEGDLGWVLIVNVKNLMLLWLVLAVYRGMGGEPASPDAPGGPTWGEAAWPASSIRRMRWR